MSRHTPSPADTALLTQLPGDMEDRVYTSIARWRRHITALVQHGSFTQQPV